MNRVLLNQISHFMHDRKLTMKTGIFGIILFLLISPISAETPYIGVSLTELSKEDIEQLGTDCAVKIEMVVPGSPAEEAGLQEGWIILSINNKRVCSPDDVESILNTTKTNVIVVLLTLSEKEEHEIFVELGDRDELSMENYISQIFSTRRKYVGFNIQFLSVQLKSFFGVENGVLVSEVEFGSPAYLADIRAGDVVMTLDGHLVDKITDMRKLLKRKEVGDTLLIVADRRGEILRRELLISEKKIDSLADVDIDDWIIAGQSQADYEELRNWIQNLVSDSTKSEIKITIEKMKQELDNLKENL
ncbi:MAG: PDZ domain-containing protein [Candidatus Cloacimonetes bacterium]|nr:PDZ domain-containing protein [Candidatus Cloacimonadota bacterium]